MQATQHTTLNTEGGLALLNGLLCCSPDWFRAIETGDVPSTTLDGVISRVFMSGHNDFPEFEIDAGGQRSRWARVVSKPHIGTGVGNKVPSSDSSVRGAQFNRYMALLRRHLSFLARGAVRARSGANSPKSDA
jgi:hypothetical protein